MDWCDSAFRIGSSTFPSDTDDPQPTVEFSDKLFSEEVLADTPVSVHEEMPMLALQVFTDVGAPLIPPVIDQPVRRNMDGLVCKDKRMDEISVFSCPICDPSIHNGTWDMECSHGDTEWVCRLYSAGTGSVDNGTVAIKLDGQSLDHWRGVVWDPGIVGQQCLHGCYDCLCLMVLFRSVMLLVHDWAEWCVWTETKTGYCRTIAWELGYMGSIHPPCDVDRLSDRNAWQIKEFTVLVMTDGDDSNRHQRCACVRGTSLGILCAGRILLMVIGWIGGGGGPMGHSD